MSLGSLSKDTWKNDVLEITLMSSYNVMTKAQIKVKKAFQGITVKY